MRLSTLIFLMKLKGSIILLVVPYLLTAQNPEAILNKYLDTVSTRGFDNWSKIRSAYIESKTFYYDLNDGQSLVNSDVLTLKQYRLWPDKSVTEVFQDSTLISRFYHVNGKHLYVRGNMDPIKISTEPYEPYFEFEPVIVSHLMKNSKSIEMVGEKNFDSLLCYQVKLKTKELIWNLFINVKSFRLEYWSNSKGENIEVLTRLSDYKKIDGCLIPMSEEKIKNGKVFYWSKRTKVVLNSNIDLNKFVLNTPE